jgi:hypothetical protein
MRLRSDLAFLPLDDEIVVFSEEMQCLVGLNASAAHVAQQIKAGATPSAIARELTTMGMTSAEEARNWIAATLEALRSHGMAADGPFPEPGVSADLQSQQQQRARIEKMPPYAPFEAVAERRYRLLSSVVLMRFGMPGQAEAVDAALGHLAVGGGAEPTILLEVHGSILGSRGSVRSNIYCDKQPADFTTGLHRLAPAVKSLIWKLAIERYDFLFYIHSGVVGRGADDCILLPAASGSGKSSMTAALVHRGYRYLSDEVALIEPTTFRVPPVPLALCVKSTGFDVMSPYHPGIRAIRGHQRMDGKLVRYIPPDPATLQRTPAQVSHIVFPRYVADARTEIRRIGRSAALRRLMSECWASGRLEPGNVRELIRWITRIDCYELSFASLEDAADLVQQVAPL